MKRNFTEALRRHNSAAMATECKAMNEWWVDGDPVTDPAGIADSVIAGLTEAANILGINPIQLIGEADISPLANLNAMQIVKMLNGIHIDWRGHNWNQKRLVEKYFRDQLFQYSATHMIGWDEVRKDLLFIKEYLQAAGSTVTDDAIQSAYEDYCRQDHGVDTDLQNMIATAAKEFVSGTVVAIMNFINANAEKKPNLADAARTFLETYQTDDEAMNAILSAM